MNPDDRTAWEAWEHIAEDRESDRRHPSPSDAEAGARRAQDAYERERDGWWDR